RPVTRNGFGGKMIKLNGKIGCAMLTVVLLLGLATAFNSTASAQFGGRQSDPGDGPLLIGYWHNFVNAAGFIQLGEVSDQFDVINVAFATPVSGSTSTIGFKVDSLESQSQFISDIASLHSLGKKVVLSIGGGNRPVQLDTNDDLQNFVSSVSSIVNEFGFDGIDIDFEGNSLALDSGDGDFKNPTTPAIVNLISALHQLKNAFGDSFIISLAPGTFAVQGGFK